MLRDVVTAASHQQGELHAENDKPLLIQRLLRHCFGRRSEQLGPDRLQFGLEDLERTVAENQAGQDAKILSRDPHRPWREARPNRDYGALPAHLPRYEVTVDIEARDCHCGGALHAMGELRTERLHIVPSQLRVRVTRRLRYACRARETGVVILAPERPIDGGLAAEALIVHVLACTFCHALPLYRQFQMLARQDIMLYRSTPASWVGRACWWLKPLHDLIVSTVLSSNKMFADDTMLPLLDPGRSRTRTGRLWCHAVDDRTWCGPGHPAAAYIYCRTAMELVRAVTLAGFRGVLQLDGHAGFKRLAGDRTDSSVQLSFCRARMWRPFYEFHVSTHSPLAAEVLARIRAFYAIETEIRGHPAKHRRQVQQNRSRSIVDALHAWLLDHGGKVSATSDLAQAICYAIRHWPGLMVFFNDGRVEMDINVVERAIRPIRSRGRTRYPLDPTAKPVTGRLP